MINKNNILKAMLMMALAGAISSCDDFLNKEPMTSIAPELYLKEESQLSFYANNLYADILPSHNRNYSYGIFGEDVDTDNQAGAAAHERFAIGLLKVPQSEGSDWKFEMIYKCNWFLNEVLPRFGESLDGSGNTISGNLANVKHYIGEVYFLRACEYFKRYQMFGDYPIITKPLIDDMGELIEASKRSPRNEVARFILSDLDKAITLLGATEMRKTRITKSAALLLKSRVALFEGTWLKYFKGTAFVPKGEGWPGSTKDYNANYAFPSGNIDSEINYFLEVSMKAAEEIGDQYMSKLTENTGKVQQSADEPINPYLNMFGQEDLEAIPEVLLWRQYARGISTHNVPVYATTGNQRIGVTRGLVESFLMADGMPIYASSAYKKDATIADVRADRDSRLSIFLKEPGQKNILIENIEGNQAKMIEPYPAITDGNSETGYTTGYALRKGGSFDQKFHANGGGYTGAICYRAVEALLNYMEASYEKNGSLNAKARSYWMQIRRRSLVSTDLEKTVNATIISEEAKNDWGAYSGGKLLTDPILYNIRRERRCELMAEGLRFMDLCRWRAMDQMITAKYHIEGFHLWNTPMEHWYDDATGKSTLLADGSGDATVSAKSISEYLRPYEKTSKQTCFDGYTWQLAHYLKPIMVKQFLITSPDGKTVEQSTIYQNPYWPMVADKPAQK